MRELLFYVEKQIMMNRVSFKQLKKEIPKYDIIYTI